MENLQEQINKLKEELNLLRASTTIPYEVGESFKIRILPNGITTGIAASGTPSTVTINESGSAIVVAQAPLTGKIALTFGGTTYIIPTTT